MLTYLRAFGATTAAVAALVTLSSCAGLGSPAGAEPAPVSTEVVDPSMQTDPTSTPTPSATAEVPATPAADPSPAGTSTPAPTAAASKAKASPFITTATWSRDSDSLDVSAIVTQRLEGPGVCNLTAVKGGVIRTAQATAAPASTYTACNPLGLSGLVLTSGTWTVTVDYESDRAAGVSAARTVVVSR
jgi:hypothetical protein